MIVSLGSCFAVNIAQKLSYYKFQILSNPFGILFHPLAIEKIIKKCTDNELFTDNDFFLHNDLWHCFDFHSAFSQPSIQELKQRANELHQNTRNTLQKSDFLIITLGTAWVYHHFEKGIVANCHKLPAKYFEKRLLSVAEIEKSLQRISRQISKINNNLKIILTVSPVRHIKDGFVENQLSKSHLISGIHSFISNNPAVEYFPAYEIMMDELRDYRFYDEDMLHPSAVAISYIWERFVTTYVDTECLTDMKLIENIQKGLNHKAFNPESEQFKIFQKDLQQKINTIKAKFQNYGNPINFEIP